MDVFGRCPNSSGGARAGAIAPSPPNKSHQNNYKYDFIISIYIKRVNITKFLSYILINVF